MGRTGIGKPQKSKKHKKLKPVDPAYAALYDKRKPKAKKAPEIGTRVKRLPNERPTQDSEKEMTLSVRRFNKMIQNAKRQNNQLQKKKHSKHKDDKTVTKNHNQMVRGMTVPVKPVPIFKQKKWETEQAFTNRMERETQTVLAKQQYEDDYNIDIHQLESGEPCIKKKKTSQKTVVRTQKKMEKEKEKKKMKHEERTTGFEHLKDDISFGEVVMQPPSLTHKPRKAAPAPNKPGTKSLLLTEIMRANSAQSTTASTKRKIGQTIKRKLLSPVQQAKMDIERQNIIEQYRMLKAKKMKSEKT